MSRNPLSCSFGGFRKQIVGVIVVSTLLTSAVWFVGVFGIPGGKLSLWGPSPNVDGLPPNDGWKNAQYHHVQYLTPINFSYVVQRIATLISSGGSGSGDFGSIIGLWEQGTDIIGTVGGITYQGTDAMGSKIAYNHIYAQVGDQFLYLLVDLPSVIVNDSTWEFVSIGIDCAGNQMVLPPPTYWGNGLALLNINGTNVNNGSRNINVFGDLYQPILGTISASLFGNFSIDQFFNGSVLDATIQKGFSATFDSIIPHRWYEIAIPMKDLTYTSSGVLHSFNTKQFGIGLSFGIGQGPILGPLAFNDTSGKPDFSKLPSLLGTMPAFCLPIIESQFFLCGTDVGNYASSVAQL